MRSRSNDSNRSSSPYRLLYIYYIQGRLTTEASLSGTDFIGNWEEDNFSFLFFSQPADAPVNQLLALQPHLKLLDQFEMTYEEWQGGPLTPLEMGAFRILPPWWDDADSSDRETIYLDPGVVFGTGSHPTTRDCMTALQLALAADPGAVTLDVGTGTGLLAIAAAKLGSSKVVAVDLNHLAARTALSNVRCNGLGEQILVLRADAEKCMDLASDLMVSNIHYDVMKHLINSKGFLNNKQFILSGLLRSQAKEIIRQLAQYPVTIKHQWANDGVWHTFYGEVRKDYRREVFGK